MCFFRSLVICHLLSPTSLGVTRVDLLLVILVTNSSLHSRPLGNAINPFEQVWEGLHVLLRESSALPALDPRPRLDVRDTVFALSISDQVLSRFASVLS